MKRRLFLFLFIASPLLVLVTIAAACGDDDGDESDEDAIRDTVQMTATACNEGDSEKLAELSTLSISDCPSGGIQDLEILSVTVDGDRAKVVTTRAAGDRTTRESLTIVKIDDRWLLSDVTFITLE